MVKPKTSAAYEIDIYDTLMREVKHLTTNTPQDKGNFNPIWSKDGKYIVYTQEQAKGTDSNIFIANVESAKSVLLTLHAGEQRYSANDISPDGKRILFSSNAANGYENIGLLEIASKKISWLTHDKWEIRGGEFSPDGKHITFSANVDGNEDIYLHDLATGKSTALPIAKGVNEPAGGHSAFTKDGSRLLYYHNGPTAPGDLWVYTLATGKSHQVTHSLVAGVRSEDMVEPYLVHYPSRDGKWTISAFLYVPYNMARNGQNAAIVYIHGGPTSQTMNSFNRFIQYAANQGYMVLAPNYRGSTGYGKEFQQANLFDMGGGDLQDVLAGVDWIKQTGHLDPKKIAVDGRQLWRISQHDGRDQSSRCVGRGRADRAVRELVHRNRERRSGTAAVRSRDHGRSSEEQSAVRRALADQLHRSDQSAAAAARGRTRSALPERGNAAGSRCHQEARRNGRVQDLRK